MKRLVLTLAAVLALCAAPSRARAAYTLTLQQIGNNVVINGSGTINFSALSNAGPTGTAGTNAYSSGYAYIIEGAGTAYSGITGPTTFGSSNTTIFSATSATGSTAGVFGGGAFLYLPTGYVSGAATSGSLTFANQTFATLNFVPGTYTYTWGTGANTDFLTVTSVVPEPSTWALLGVGAFGTGLALRRSRRPRTA